MCKSFSSGGQSKCACFSGVYACAFGSILDLGSDSYCHNLLIQLLITASEMCMCNSVCKKVAFLQRSLFLKRSVSTTHSGCTFQPVASQPGITCICQPGGQQQSGKNNWYPSDSMLNIIGFSPPKCLFCLSDHRHRGSPPRGVYKRGAASGGSGAAGGAVSDRPLEPEWLSLRGGLLPVARNPIPHDAADLQLIHQSRYGDQSPRPSL